VVIYGFWSVVLLDFNRDHFDASEVSMDHHMKKMLIFKNEKKVVLELLPGQLTISDILNGNIICEYMCSRSIVYIC